MPKNRILLKFLQVPVLVIACFALLPVVQVAAGIGISPALLSNQWLRPGMTYRQEIIISQSDPVHDLDVVIEPDLGEANDWLSYDPSDSFTISKGVKRYPMTIMFTVPEGAELKSYTGYIRIKT
ncbi:hypothetical protein KC640_02980, partial [Candidatus Dojkabacteria bacterium]|nr:hypothetical protein [Candidatus Dojkabacteria bacterium]